MRGFSNLCLRIGLLTVLIFGIMGGAMAASESDTHDLGFSSTTSSHTFSLTPQKETFISKFVIGSGGDTDVTMEVLKNGNVVASKTKPGATGGNLAFSFSKSDYSQVLQSGDSVSLEFSDSGGYIALGDGTLSFSGDLMSFSSETGFYNYASSPVEYIVIETANEAPQFNSTSVSPDPPLIGESVSYSAEASDSDGSINDLELTVFQDGSQVYQNSVSTSSNTWSNVHTAEEGSIDARFVATDDAGATTTEWVNRTLTDDAPSITLSKPVNQTYWSYDVPVEFSVSDSDSRPDEVYSCTGSTGVPGGSTRDIVFETDLHENGTTSYSDSFRADLGQHDLLLSCRDGNGNSNSASETFTVKAFEFGSLSSSPSSFESVEEQFTASGEYGEMVDSIEWELVYDGAEAASASENYTGSGSFSETLNHALPLVSSDGTVLDWKYRANLSINEFSNTGTYTDERVSGIQSQTVDQVFQLSNEYLVDGSPQLEASNLQYRANVSQKSVDAQGSISGSASFDQTGKTVQLSEENLNNESRIFSGLFESDLVDSSSENFGFDLDLTYSFDGESRNISSDALSVQLDRMELAGSGDAEALRFDSFDENGTSLSSDVEANFQIWNPDSPDLTREYGYSSTGKNQHSVYLTPGYGEIHTDVFGDNYIEYDASGSQSDFYDARNYYLLNETLNNQTSIVDLYLLPKEKASSVELNVENPSYEPLADHVVRIERSFDGGSESRTVAMAQTGSSGTDSVFIDPGEQYVFTIYNPEGERIEKIGPESIPRDNSIRLEAEESTIQTYDNLVEGVDFETQLAEDGVVVNFDTSSGESVNALRLTVSEDTMFDSIEVGSDESSATSGQLVVDGINSSSKNYNYKLEAFYDDAALSSDTGVLLDSGRFGSGSSDVGEAGLFMSLLLFITLTFSGLWREEASIALGALSLVVASFIGFLPIGQTALIAVVSVAAVLIWRMT